MKKQFIEQVQSILFPFKDFSDNVVEALENNKLGLARGLVEDFLNERVESLVRVLDSEDILHHNTTVMLIEDLQKIYETIENEMLAYETELLQYKRQSIE